MITEQQYVIMSLELHLFFGRIKKEHSIFMELGFMPIDSDLADVADQYKEQFEVILRDTVNLSNGIIRPSVIESGEIVTDYTLGSEQKTQDYTGVKIDEEITRLESDLYGIDNPQIPPSLVEEVKRLNARVLQVLASFIDFNARILNDVLSCQMFTTNYPLLLEHILHEAQAYRTQINTLESMNNPDENIKEMELFWDEIMMEHAMFIRGLLDPSEGELIETANGFVLEYANLLEEARNATDDAIIAVTGSTLEETTRLRNFKEAGTVGIAQCEIRSIILPLLADHVLREANHFIRLLEEFS